MLTEQSTDLAKVLSDIQSQLALLSERIARLESSSEAAVEDVSVSAAPAPATEPKAAPEPPHEAITEEELIAISAALAAYFGVRVRVRQIRLISSPAWAQQGRVSIQASHRLH